MKIFFFIILLVCFQQINTIIDRTYFNYLGLKITASPQDILKAYQSKLQKIQSIQNQQQKNKKMKLLKEAYQTLSNQKQRQKYQRYGKDIFKTIKQLTCIDKRNPQNPRDQRKSPSFKLTLPVSIGQIYNGTTIKAKFPKGSACSVCQGTGAKSPKDLKPCPHCAGKGFSLRQQQNFYGQKFQAETICPICKGSGKTVLKTCQNCKGSKLLHNTEIIQIIIPKGLPNGNKITYRNYGDQSLHGAPSDFQINIVEIPTKQWSRQGDNLVYLMNIDLQQSLFGFKKEFEHLDGSLQTVDRTSAMTTKDTKYLIKGKGFINKQGYAGNLVVKFKVNIPTFTDQQLDMWEDFFNEHPM